MSEVTIRVRGEHSSRTAPEKAVVHMVVRCQRESSATAAEAVQAELARVRTHLSGGTGIGDLYVDQLRTWVEQLAPEISTTPRHVAELGLRVEFTDFVLMAERLTAMAELAEVQIGWTDWRVTGETRRALEREARRAALDQARQRAEDYAESLGVGSVVPVVVSDQGLLGPVPGAARMMAVGFKEAGNGSGIFQPEDVQVAAEVEVEYRATS